MKRLITLKTINDKWIVSDGVIQVELPGSASALYLIDILHRAVM